MIFNECYGLDAKYVLLRYMLFAIHALIQYHNMHFQT